MVEEITPVQGIRNNVKHLIAAIADDDVTVISAKCHIVQGGKMRESTGEMEYLLHYKFYNPARDRIAGDTVAGVLPCDKCGKKGRRASGADDSRGSMFHEGDCPYQIEQDDADFYGMKKAAKSHTEESDWEPSHWENTAGKAFRRCWCGMAHYRIGNSDWKQESTG